MDNITPRDTKTGINEEGAFRSSGYRSVDSSYDSAERESWKGMVQNLYSDINNLWQKESLLIRTELNEKVSDVKTAASSFAIGGQFFLSLCLLWWLRPSSVWTFSFHFGFLRLL